jgi:putative spermidine/putrescine transport system permease protein
MKRRISVLAISINIIVAIFFIFPFISALEFSLRGYGGVGHTFENYFWILRQDNFSQAIFASLNIAFLSSVLVLVLVVPSVVHLHLAGHKYRKFVEVLSLLPALIPSVSLAVAIQYSRPNWLQIGYYELSFFNVLIAFPFVFRSLDSSLKSIPLLTLVEASKTLGGNWIKTLLLIIIPSVLSATIASMLITVALSFGEYTLATILNFQTVPTWAVDVSQENLYGSVSLSIGALFFSWIILVVLVFFPKVSKGIYRKLDRRYSI